LKRQIQENSTIKISKSWFTGKYCSGSVLCRLFNWQRV
jgi:hypothetical protein